MPLLIWPNNRRGDVEGIPKETSFNKRDDTEDAYSFSGGGGSSLCSTSLDRDEPGVHKTTRKSKVKKDKISRCDLCRRIIDLIDIPSGSYRRTGGYFTKSQLIRLHFWIQDSIAIRVEHREMVDKLFHETAPGEKP